MSKFPDYGIIEGGDRQASRKREHRLVSLHPSNR